MTTGYLFSLILVAVLCGIVHAQPPGLTDPKPVADEIIPGEDSYRLQTIVVDAAAVGLVAAAAGFNKAPLLDAGAAVYLAGAPTIHAFHGRFGSAAISVGMRVVFPVVTGYALSRAFADGDHGEMGGWIY